MQQNNPITQAQVKIELAANEQLTEKEKNLVAKEKAKQAKKTAIQKGIDDFIAEMNSKYTHVVSNGKNYICRVSTNQLNYEYLEFFTLEQFNAMLLNAPEVQIGETAKGDPKYKSASSVWLKHTNKSMCDMGITFYPVDERFYKGKLNSYFGFGVEPIANEGKDDAQIKAYLSHIYNVMCSKNAECYEYFIKWIAHAVQRPHEKPEVAILLQGGQGSGKGTVMTPLQLIFGSHYAHPQNPDHVLGNFNGMLETCILLFADEFFAGDKRSTNKLKGMITEMLTTMERKGIDAIQIFSYMRLILASNNKNVIAMERDERRYFVPTIYEFASEAEKDDYFDKLYETLGSKEQQKEDRVFAGKLLHYLQSIDLGKWHPRKMPKTEGLAAHKLDNLDNLDAWLYSCIQRGSFELIDMGNDAGRVCEARLPTTKIIDYLEAWEKHASRKIHGDKSTATGILLKKMGVRKLSTGRGTTRKTFYEFPTLEQMRDSFEKYIKASIDW